MSQQQRVTLLELRRKMLLLESDVNRLELRGEMQQLRQKLKWVSRLGEMRRGTGAIPVVLAGVAGLGLGVWRNRGLVGSLARAAALVRPALGLWRKFGAPPGPQHGPPA